MALLSSVRLCFQVYAYAFKGTLCFQVYVYAFKGTCLCFQESMLMLSKATLMLSSVRLCFQGYAYAFKGLYAFKGTLMLSTVNRLCFQVNAYAFKCESLMLSIVNGFYLAFKAGCLGYLYLTVDVYNNHFCHLKFYPQNRLYFQNITNERKSILFITH